MSFARMPRVIFAVGVAALLGSLAVSAHAVTIDWVTVGDPGNTADTTGAPNPAGAVADAFQIMKFEFTNQQYKDFLNSVVGTLMVAGCSLPSRLSPVISWLDGVTPMYPRKERQ